MNLAIVHPYAVHSQAPGGTTRVDALVRYLAPRHSVSVFVHASGDSEADRRAVDELGRLGVEQHVLPRPRAGWGTRLGWALGPTPYFVRHNRSPALSERLAECDRRRPFDALHVEFAYLAPLLEGCAPGAARVLAEQECASLAIERLARVPAHRRRLYEHFLRWSRRKVRRYERLTLPRFDRVFGISPAEAQRLEQARGGPVEVLPHVVCTRRFAPAPLPGPQADLLFVGNYAHAPNLEALAWFASQVWPRLRSARPGLRALLAGPGLDERRWRGLGRPGLERLGHVADLVERYRAAAVVVNPVRSGGGMRGKVLEAGACGCALVSTRLGLEGFAGSSGEHCLAADEPADFAAAVLRYLDDPDLRRAHGKAARALVCRRYDPGAVFPRLEAAYAEARGARSAPTGR